MRDLASGWRTIQLLFGMDRVAFLVSTCASICQALIYPAVLVIIWQWFSLVLNGRVTDLGAIQQRTVLLLGVFFGLLATQTILQIVNETAASMLRAESAQRVNGRIVDKMSEVPYRLFEDNAFQARYGLLISQASYRPGMLVEGLVGGCGALAGCLAIAVTLAALAPLLNVFLLILIPLAIVEARFHLRIIDVQTTAAPALFRMTHLTQKSIDATWQRDLRVYNSRILHHEYTSLASAYIDQLKRLLMRYQGIRIGVGMCAAAVMTGAVAAVFWHVSQAPDALSQAAILLPALIMGLTQGRALASSWGLLTECLAYLSQVFEFLEEPFDDAAPAQAEAETARAWLAA